MPDYKKMYLLLFNTVTDAIRALEAGDTQTGQNLLKQDQLEAEQTYIETGGK